MTAVFWLAVAGVVVLRVAEILRIRRTEGWGRTELVCQREGLGGGGGRLWGKLFLCDHRVCCGMCPCALLVRQE